MVALILAGLHPMQFGCPYETHTGPAAGPGRVSCAQVANRNNQFA
jgi:hypothetical protein